MQIGKRFLALVILIVFLAFNGNYLFPQDFGSLMTPSIDSIFLNTLDFLEIKNSLVRQQFEIQQKERQIEKTLSVLNKHNAEIGNERQSPVYPAPRKHHQGGLRSRRSGALIIGNQMPPAVLSLPAGGIF